MGTYYDLKCPKCEYAFTAYFGPIGFHKYDQAAKERVQSNTDSSEVTRVAKTMMSNMKKIKIKSKLHPFQCLNCRTFFNYNCVVLLGDEGYYEETKATCPICGKRSSYYLNEKSLFGKEDYGYGECNCRCPQCGIKLTVTKSGICD